jgi:hypothetical protein
MAEAGMAGPVFGSTDWAGRMEVRAREAEARAQTAGEVQAMFMVVFRKGSRKGFLRDVTEAVTLQRDTAIRSV